jgi:hypothetical protein
MFYSLSRRRIRAEWQILTVLRLLPREGIACHRAIRELTYYINTGLKARTATTTGNTRVTFNWCSKDDSRDEWCDFKFELFKSSCAELFQINATSSHN